MRRERVKFIISFLEGTGLKFIRGGEGLNLSSFSGGKWVKIYTGGGGLNLSQRERG